VIADIYAANRAHDDVPYYSPRSDFSWSGGVRSDWSIYRRYRFAVSQSLALQAGRYDQASFGAGGIWSADYRLSLTMGERWYTDFGVRRQRGFYDGTPEHATYFSASFSGRF